MSTGIRKFLFLILISGYIPASLTAQAKIQVVSKSITRTFKYSAGTVIQVNGEKAQIKVRPSLTKQINLVITLIAKNPSLQEAENDVKYCNYTINESTDKIIIANNFDLKKGYKEISSNLSAKIELEIPAELSIIVRNIYGIIDLKDIQGSMNITNDFGQLIFKNTKGPLNISSKYGDISGLDVNAITAIDAKNSDIVINNVNKMLNIKDQYGTITLESLKAPVIVDCDFSVINVDAKELNNWSCDFSVLKGNIIVPEEYQKFLRAKSGEINFKTSPGKISIKLKTTYNNITIK